MAPESQARPNEPILLRSDAGGVCTLTLNRPDARNALSTGLMQAVQDELDAIAKDESVRVVVIAGAGPGFCAGHDMRELRADPTEAFYRQAFKASSRIMMTIGALPQPVIARVHGVATAAGCQLVASCDLAVASTKARFATPGVHIGLFCSTPMVPISRKIGRKAMMEMLLLGDMVEADDAHRLGLVNRVVAEDALDETIGGMAAKIAAKSPVAIRMGKEAYYRQLEMDLADAYAHCGEVMTKTC